MDVLTGYTSQGIYETLRDEILALQIKPGEMMFENDICKRFAVSRTPVRTAFQRLKEAGLLKIVPYKGTYATLLDFENIEQLIYMRIAVETMVIRDLIDSADLLMMEKINHNIRRQEILISGTFETKQFYEIDSQFHQLWFNYMHKETLWKAIQKAQINYTRFRMLDIVAVQNFDEIYAEHIALFNIIKNKDKDGIEPFVRKHLYGGINRLGDRIDTEFSSYFVKRKQ